MKNNEKENEEVRLEYNSMILIGFNRRQAFYRTIAELCSYDILIVQIRTYQGNLNQNRIYS